MNNPINRKLLLIPTFAILMYAVKAQNNWVLKTDQDGIKVYTCTQTDSKIKAVKVECTLKATLSQLAVVIFDINTSNQWVYRTSNCAILKQINPWDIYYYAQVETPWPVADRDFIAHLKLSQNPVTRVMVVEADNAPYFVPLKHNVVRIMHSVSKWVVSLQDKYTIKVEYTLFTDPGGNVPAWLINMFITKGPLESFQKLREHIKKPAYAHVNIPSIKDY
ncbi:MAG: START domain-containing protein [Bacteroidota bacterium]